jgi:hypothetical protein
VTAARAAAAPILVKATLVKRTTAEGLVEFQADVPIGKVYLIDPTTQRVETMLNVEKGCFHKKEVVSDRHGAWLPVECLQMEAAC